MSFPRAAIRRFNEPADTTIPPPGAYDPKFHTDVAVASSNRGIGFDTWDRRRSTSTGSSRNTVFVGSDRSVAAGAPLGATGVIPIRTRSSSTCPGSRRSSVTKTQTGAGSSAAGRGEYNLTRQSTSRVSFHSSVPAERRSSREGSSASKISRRRSSAAGIIVTTTSPNESFTITTIGRSQTRLGSGRASSKPRPPRPRSRPSPLRHSRSLRRTPSVTATCTPSSMQLYNSNPAYAENLRDTLKIDGTFNPQVIMMPEPPQQIPTTSSSQQPPTTPPPANNNIYVLEPGEVILRPPSGSLMSSSRSQSQSSQLKAFQTSSTVSSGTIFDEIQSLAESLQRELAEYKSKLTKECKRTQELDAKKLELEFINHSLKRQLERYEAAKDNWEIGELNNRSKIDELTRERDVLEEKFHQVQSQVEALRESESKLKGKADKLEEEKQKWQEEERKYESKVDGLQAILKDEQLKRSEVETKIKDLEAQMDSCYHTCESRMADAENMKETYEVKIQELSEQVEELMAKLDGMRRELETQKTLMDMMKQEHQEEQERNRILREEQNYIS